jgi:hypothetical protein
MSAISIILVILLTRPSVTLLDTNRLLTFLMNLNSHKLSHIYLSNIKSALDKVKSLRPMFFRKYFSKKRKTSPETK